LRCTPQRFFQCLRHLATFSFIKKNDQKQPSKFK
jgi:hypothetical protein